MRVFVGQWARCPSAPHRIVKHLRSDSSISSSNNNRLVSHPRHRCHRGTSMQQTTSSQRLLLPEEEAAAAGRAHRRFCLIAAHLRRPRPPSPPAAKQCTPIAPWVRTCGRISTTSMTRDGRFSIRARMSRSRQACTQERLHTHYRVHWRLFLELQSLSPHRAACLQPVRECVCVMWVQSNTDDGGAQLPAVWLCSFPSPRASSVGVGEAQETPAVAVCASWILLAGEKRLAFFFLLVPTAPLWTLVGMKCRRGLRTWQICC